jgi:hypothetical protein
MPRDGLLLFYGPFLFLIVLGQFPFFDHAGKHPSDFFLVLEERAGQLLGPFLAIFIEGPNPFLQHTLGIPVYDQDTQKGSQVKTIEGKGGRHEVPGLDFFQRVQVSRLKNGPAGGAHGLAANPPRHGSGMKPEGDFQQAKPASNARPHEGTSFSGMGCNQHSGAAADDSCIRFHGFHSCFFTFSKGLNFLVLNCPEIRENFYCFAKNMKNIGNIRNCLSDKELGL